MSALLAQWEMIKKDNHGKHYHNQLKQFLPFVLSVDRMIWRKTLVLLLQLSRVMSEKRAEALSQVRGWVNGQITISVARSYSRMIRGSHLPSPLWEQDPDWDPESGIGLAG